MSSEYIPTSYCYEKVDINFPETKAKCPVGLECCNIFVNGKGDCGPKKYCDE